MPAIEVSRACHVNPPGWREWRAVVRLHRMFCRRRHAVGAFTGLPVAFEVVLLIGALATSRAQRLREGALLKTLGARRNQVLTVLFAEYLALGSVATASGLALAIIASALVVPVVFEIDYALRLGPVAAIWTVVVLLTVVTGLAGSRDLLRRPPLPVLRDAPE